MWTLNHSPWMSLNTVALGNPTSSSPPSRSDMVVEGSLKYAFRARLSELTRRGPVQCERKCAVRLMY